MWRKSLVSVRILLKDQKKQMKTMLHILTLFIVALSLGGCDGEEQPVPRQKVPVIYNENPTLSSTSFAHYNFSYWHLSQRNKSL